MCKHTKKKKRSRIIKIFQPVRNISEKKILSFFNFLLIADMSSSKHSTEYTPATGFKRKCSNNTKEDDRKSIARIVRRLVDKVEEEDSSDEEDFSEKEDFSRVDDFSEADDEFSEDNIVYDYEGGSSRWNLPIQSKRRLVEFEDSSTTFLDIIPDPFQKLIHDMQYEELGPVFTNADPAGSPVTKGYPESPITDTPLTCYA